MTRDEINARIEACEAEYAEVHADIVNGPQTDQPTDLTRRRDDLTREIAALKAMLEEE